MVFFLILLSGVQHDFLNLCICCKESLIPPNRNVVCTVLRYLKTIRGSCLNPWELFESGWCSDRNRHGPRPKRFAFAIWTINPFHFLSDIFKCEEIKIGSNNYPRVSLVELSPIFKRFIHPKITHTHQKTHIFSAQKECCLSFWLNNVYGRKILVQEMTLWSPPSDGLGGKSFGWGKWREATKNREGTNGSNEVSKEA